MANGNKTLGRFQLTGIASAPRGIPQIEVTFDIDANGIVHVSAKDLGTGNEQKITITASTNLSEDEIDKAVKEAEMNAEADRLAKESIEARNIGDTTVYQTEKTLKDVGEKLTDDDKTDVLAAIESLKEALKGTETEAIKTATEQVTEAMNKLSEKIYQQDPNAGGQAGPDMGGQPQEDEDVVDADYEVVDEDEE